VHSLRLPAWKNINVFTHKENFVGVVKFSVAHPDTFDTDPDPAFQFDTDPTV
jgi:hypothetical protein